jgi:nitric oxide synthase oxygenase domain/subunit
MRKSYRVSLITQRVERREETAGEAVDGPSSLLLPLLSPFSALLLY